LRRDMVRARMAAKTPATVEELRAELDRVRRESLRAEAERARAEEYRVRLEARDKEKDQATQRDNRMIDILLAQIPGVLRVDVYATAALLGAAVTVVGLKLSLPPTLMSISGIIVCFLLRVVSVWRHWQLPKVMGP